MRQLLFRHSLGSRQEIKYPLWRSSFFPTSLKDLSRVEMRPKTNQAEDLEKRFLDQYMPSYEKKSDALLWENFKSGDKLALDIIFKRYYPLLYNYGVKITKNVALTKDCLQDFFLYLYEHRQNLKDLDTIKPYLFKAFRNRLFKYAKANTNLVFLEEVEKNGVLISFSIEELVIQQENNQLQKEQILQLLNQLTNKQKELIYLKYYNNLSIREIAEVVNISYQGVLNGLSKTMKKLRKLRE